MRILQVVHGFPPNEWAGTELVTLQLSQTLRERGHDVTVLTRVYDTHETDGSLRETRYENVSVLQLVNNYTTNSTFRLLYDNPLFNQPFLRVLDQVQPDVVHFQHALHLSVSFLRLAAALKYPTVLSLHDFFFACHRIQLINAQQQLCPGPDQGERCVLCLHGQASSDEARVRFRDMAQVLQTPDRILTPSAFLAEKMLTYFPLLQDRLQVLPLGVRAVLGGTRAITQGEEQSPLRLLYVGTLAPHKGAHVLLEAIRGLANGTVEVSLYGFAGEPWQTYVERLHETAKDLTVKFCGVYAHEQLGDILANHDVLIMPMIWEETFSLVTREALLAGVPVVAARRGALPEVVQDHINGLLFEPESAVDLRRCIQKLVTERGLLEKLRTAETAIKTPETYAQEIEDCYLGVMNARPVKESTTQSKGTTDEVRAPQYAGMHTPPVKVSVCIPTYNGSTFLAESINSVLSQSFQDFELVIVDDRSTDATLDIARSFSDPRIVVHQNDRQLGIPGNWNQCLALAKGEYLCIFHQDDRMWPENLLRKVQCIESDKEITLVHSAIEPLVEAHAPAFSSAWLERADHDFVVDGLQYFRKLLLSGNCICAPAVLTRRQLLQELGGFDESLHFTPDYAMWMRLCLNGRIAFIHQPLLGYRWHGQNASHAFRFERGLEETLSAAEKALQYYVEQTGDEAEGMILREALGAVTQSRRWMVELDRSKEWLEEQWKNWQRIAKEREEIIQEQRVWITDLEKGKGWLEEQWKNWQTTAEDQAQILQEYEARIATLASEVEEQQHLHEYKQMLLSHWWIHLGVRLKTLKPFDPKPSRKD
jgi:glycosyltransferase involved in cell wall biosynthesis